MLSQHTPTVKINMISFLISPVLANQIVGIFNDGGLGNDFDGGADPSAGEPF